MPHTYTDLLSHIIFSTKNRVPLIDAELKPRLLPYLGGIVKRLEGVPLLINGPADHLHLLVVLPAKLAVADFVEKVKANSSGWVHKTFPERGDFVWQTGYAAFSVSHSQKQTVLDYIAGQEEHDRKVSFQEELVAFLKKHEIEFDEKEVFE